MTHARSAVVRDRIALAAFALVLALFGWQGLTHPDGSLRAEQDHTITLSLSRQLATWHEYHPDFVYPLPAVVMKLALGALGTKPSSLVWMTTLILSGVACVRALSRLLPPVAGRSRLAAPLLGALAIVYCLQWDFRAVNGNTAFLALVLCSFSSLGRGQGRRAGALLAASIALKLYSAPLLALFALRGQWRAVGWGLAGLIGFFVVLPVLWFGPSTAMHLSRLFVEQLIGATSIDASSRVTAYNVSLWTVVHALQGGDSESVSMVVATTARAIGFAFAVGVTVWLWRGRSIGRGVESEAHSNDATAIRGTTAVGLVLAAVLLLSPIAQPHHGVLLWPLAAVTARLALDGSARPKSRGVAALLLAATGLALIAAPSGVGKSIAQNAAIFLLAAGGLLAVRAGRDIP